MTTEEKIEICKACKNQKFDLSQGIVCGLNNMKPAFEDSCESYIEDAEKKQVNEIKKSERELEDNLAPKGKRFANFIIDLILYYAFVFVLAFISGLVFAVVNPDAITLFYNKLFVYLFAIFAFAIFYSAFEATTGKTVGKYITKTRVVDENGNKPKYGTVLLRTFCRLIPFEPFSFIGDLGTGWHDKLSKTYVVED